MSDDVGARIFAQIYDEKAPMRERVARLVELLRSEEPIPAGTRQLLGDIFDPDAGSKFCVELKERRGKGERKDEARQIVRSVRDSNIANALIERINSGESRKAVVDDLCATFSVSRTHVQNIAKTYKRRLSPPSSEME
ncbi:hypothetical protein [Methylocystis sp.]|uniref:hypothetical protein n=1 Tax=Methylocystis sp. TaxID=1911079 RepID=UPI003DA20EC4